nr:unnamed protein product [Fasciola hepatica]
MDWQWEIGYIGCQVEFQVNWNGTIKVFFFLKEMDTDFREECLSASATNFNQLIQEQFKLFGTRFSEVIITKSNEAQNEVMFCVDPSDPVNVMYQTEYSRTSQNAIEILKNQVTLLQTTVSDSTITENKGSTWSDLVSLCTILPLLLLLFQ